MRVGPFEVFVIDQDGHRLEETLIDNKQYAVASPGKEYIIKVQVYKNIETNSFPAENMRVGLYVDGQDVQYWKRLDTSLLPKESNCVNSIFHGYKKGKDDLRSFIFAKPRSVPGPSSGSSSAASPYASAAPAPSHGTIQVVIFEAEQVQGIVQNVGGKYEVPGQHQINSEGKFYKQPSVTTIGGRNITEAERFVPLLRWKNKTDTPLVTMDLFYHSPEMIQFLELFHQERGQGGQGGSDSGGASGSGRGGGAVSGGSREKRKRDEIVDLTDEALESEETETSVPTQSQPSYSSALNRPFVSIVTRSSTPTSALSSSFFSPTYTISSSELTASDEVEVLTVVKEVPLLDMTGEDDET
jgi:hypothetical protein